MSFTLQGKQAFSVILSVLLTTLVVAFVAHGTTYVNTSSVGIGTDTPGVASSVKGAGLFEGFVSAGYFTSTSTSNSWFMGNVGLGSTTPGIRLGVHGDADIAGVFTTEDNSKSSYFTGTSTTATTTFKGGLAIGTSNFLSDIQSGNTGIGTTTYPTVLNNAGASAGYKTKVSVGAGSATTTLYIAGGATTGSEIILRSTDGIRCVAIMATNGAGALDSAAVLSVKVVTCPMP